MRLPLLFAGATAAAGAGNSVLVFGDSWGDTGPTYKVIQDALKAHGVTGTVKSSAVGGTTACGWAKDPQALVTAAKKQFGDAGPDFVWYTAGGNDLIGDKTFHSCTKNAKSLEEAQACYIPATDIANTCTSTMFDAYWKVFPNSKIMQCNYDIACETGLCSVLDTGYFGNYCKSNVTCLNHMGVAFQDAMVGRLRKKYPQPQYTGLLIGGTVQAATGDSKASPPVDGKDGVPDLDKSGPCDQMVACVHPKYGSAAATAVGEVFYDQWLKKYATTDADAHDAERQRLIDETNSKQGLWKAHHNARFRGAPVGASQPLLGLLDGEEERIGVLVDQGIIGSVDAVTRAIPDDFESATAFPQCAKVINDIRDQSNCGCCWAFSAAEAGSDRLCIQTNGSAQVPLSAQDMCFCSNSNGCGGGSQSSAWRYIESHGLVTGSQQQPDDGKTDPFAGAGYCSSFSLPHCHHHGPTGNDPYPAEGAKGCPSERSPKCPTKCDSSAAAPHNSFAADKYKVSAVSSYRNADAMAQAIMEQGPISVGFTVYSDFENYASGIYKHTGGSSLGGHAVRIVGFGTDKGTKYWKVANSWNPYWGENGYFRIVRGTNEVGIEGSAVASSASAKWTVPQ